MVDLTQALILTKRRISDMQIGLKSFFKRIIVKIQVTNVII